MRSREGPRLENARNCCGVAQIEDKVFAVGGEGLSQGGGEPNFLCSIEVLSLTNTPHVWFPGLLDLPSPRAAMGSVAVGSTIYVFGGFDGSEFLASCICWATLMVYGTMVHNTLWLIGGYNAEGYLPSVAIFDFGTRT
ncbi:hypothetical protein T484DRAFT_1813996 [Baffinella frigidus]|nr:hypothetical protein T484DRAFT_1813996 [Cryptophyta sp. CCMP2293]